MKSLLRHQCAYKLVTSWSSDVREKAVELAQGYPIDLRTSGTMQTLAFSISKKDKSHDALVQAIANWVLSPESGGPLGVFADKERSPSKLLRLLAEASVAPYVAADAEAIAFADAIKIIGKAVKGSGEVLKGSR